GVAVEALPGPSSPAAAISVSGMEAPGYHFAGYPPSRSGARKRFLEGLKAMERARLEADPRAVPWPLVLFEAPHRIAASLKEMLEVLGDRRVLLLREMTKLHEESVEGTLSSVASRFGGGPGRGEFTLVIEGGRGEDVAETGPEEGIRRAYQALIDSGAGRKEALRTLAVRSGRSRRDLYRELVVGEDEEDS
ncbi:MAG TPA: SAM-dependent methyltransferase, partial [Candidatus Saccharimonadales bacterium]|nr:SAM-dependent methyltransferase [Candidatus Saccharimonadales bacterium]